MSLDSLRKTILIVDDDPDVRLFVAGLMKTSGYRAVSADNRDHGLEKARSEQPDCIILNCTMGGEDGMALYKIFKTRDELKQIPVVLVSPVSEEIIRQHWMLRHESVAAPEAFVESPPEAGSIIAAVGALTGMQLAGHPGTEP